MKGFGDRLLIDDLTFKLPRSLVIVGVVGANGAGKTTLFRMITGAETPDAGSLNIGATVELAYVDQSRDVLDSESTVYDCITGGVDNLKIGNREVHGRSYCAVVQLQGPRPAEEGRGAFWRRTKSSSPCAHPEGGGKRAVVGRANE